MLFHPVPENTAKEYCSFHTSGGKYFFHVTQKLGDLKNVYPFAPILFPVSWCSQDVAAGTNQSCSFEFMEDSSLLAYYSNNHHFLTKTNKQSIRKSKVFQNKHICQNLVILHLGGGGASDRLNGFQMDRKCRLWKLCNSRWPGSVLAGRPARGPLIAKKGDLE